MKLKLRTDRFVDLEEWDKLVVDTYQRPYALQQQDARQCRGFISLTVPDPNAEEYGNDTIPEMVNGEKMGVTFAAWLSRDPKAPIGKGADGGLDYMIELFWYRNFYPSLQVVANDLYTKGLLEAGDYTIVIDW